MGKRNQTMDSAVENSVVFTDYYKRLKELAINMFEWKNLPDEIDERFLELVLFEQGFSVFFRDEIAEQYAVTQVMIGGNLDIYRIPKWRYAYAVNGYNRKLSDIDSVIIFNNYLREPSRVTIELFARRLYDVERAINVNVCQQKFPIIIKTPESQRLTMKNLYMQWSGNVPFIFGDTALDTSGIEAIKTDVPYVADKLTIIKAKIWNEALTYLGIENSNTDKKERLVTDEIESNQGAVEAQRFTRLNARRQACKKINSMFGLNVSVDFRSEFQSTPKNTDTTEHKPSETEGK